MEKRILTDEMLKGFAAHMTEEERSENTRQYYLRVLRELAAFAGTEPVTKQTVIDFKEQLTTSGYTAGTVNTYLSALGSFFDFAGWPELKVRHLKVQPKAYAAPEELLTLAEYNRMLAAAESPRLRLLAETLAGTGIRVSELRFFTVEAICRSSFTVTNKGKTREVILVPRLKKKLLRYALDRGIRSGPIFRTRTGKPLSRSYIWTELKKLALRAGVAPGKVFPHNLRKLFARQFYELKKDIAKLADVLGHSSINTTRIYILSSVREHQRGMERMRLVT